MMKKILDTRTFSDAAELIEALMIFQDSQPSHTLYVESEGFFVSGKARLIEETLSDDSLVYNIELVQDED